MFARWHPGDPTNYNRWVPDKSAGQPAGAVIHTNLDDEKEFADNEFLAEKEDEKLSSGTAKRFIPHPQARTWQEVDDL